MSQAETVTGHEKIKAWAAARGGRPSRVAETAGKGGEGILRFDFGDKDDALEELSWDDFFKIFDDNKLALLEQEETKGGAKSRFAKFVAR